MPTAERTRNPAPMRPCDVSVVVPCFDAAGTLDLALESVAAQTAAPGEVVVVDDGSTDGSREILGRWIRQRSPATPFELRALYRPHRGAAAARNTGWREASGSWVAFLDADDRWRADKLKAVATASSRYPGADVVYSDATRTFEGATIGRWSSHAMPHEGQVFRHLIRRNFVCQSTVVVRREVLEDASGYDESMEAWEDIDLWLRICQSHEFAYCPEPLVEYVATPNSLSLQGRMMAQGRLRSVAAALESEAGGTLPELVRREALALAHRYASEAEYLDGDGPASRRHALTAMTLHPPTCADMRFARMYAQSFVRGDWRRSLRQLRQDRVRRHRLVGKPSLARRPR